MTASDSTCSGVSSEDWDDEFHRLTAIDLERSDRDVDPAFARAGRCQSAYDGASLRTWTGAGRPRSAPDLPLEVLDRAIGPEPSEVEIDGVVVVFSRVVAVGGHQDVLPRRDHERPATNIGSCRWARGQRTRPVAARDIRSCQVSRIDLESATISTVIGDYEESRSTTSGSRHRVTSFVASSPVFAR